LDKNVHKKDNNELSEEEIASCLHKWIEDLEEDLIDALTVYLKPFIADISNKLKLAIFKDNTSRKKKQDDFMDKLNDMYIQLYMFYNGIQSFGGPNTVLEKHLLKTKVNDFINAIIENQAIFHCIETTNGITNTEQRNLILSKLPSNVSLLIEKLVDAQIKQKLDVFFEELENLVGGLQLHFKKFDKKEQRNRVFSYKQQLLEQLKAEDNPATVLLLVVLILCAQIFGYALHAPGRAVSALLTALKPQLPPEIYKPLDEYHNMVVQYLSKDEHKKEDDDKLLNEKLPAIKQIPMKNFQLKEEK